MIDLILQITHVSEFTPTSGWSNRIVNSLSQLNLNTKIHYVNLDDDSLGLTNQELHSLSHQTDQPLKSEAIINKNWYINLLITHSHKDSNLLGIMFDNLGDRKREGCAVFIDPISTNFDAAEQTRVLARTAIHEIGHAFNFCHPAAFGSDISVMLPTREAQKKANWLESSSFEYSQADKDFFTLERDLLCKPGSPQPSICRPQELEEDMIQ